jgi:hypothetical protein
MTAAALSEKNCGECTLCCKVMAVETLEKPAGAWCRHCRPGHGCLIHPERPAECRDFGCLWLTDARLGPEWKPGKSKLVLTTSEDGIEVRCDPGFPEAWRKEPYHSQIRQWAASGEARDVTVLVVINERMILVTAEQEFDLGIVRPDQRIVREIEGTRVTGATLVQASELE